MTHSVVKTVKNDFLNIFSFVHPNLNGFFKLSTVLYVFY